MLYLAAGILAFASTISPVLAQSQLGTTTENRDGVVEDVAGPRSFDVANYARVWLAEGRLRAALRMSDLERIHSETKLFDSAVSGTYEKPVALEFNDTNGRLYTLTEAGLYREETDSPYSQSAPGALAFINFSDLTTSAGLHLEPEESFQDLKLWPGTNRVFLLTSHRIISLVDNGSSGLALASTSSWSTAMFPPSTHTHIQDTTSDADFNSYEVHRFLRFRLFKETLGSPALTNHLIALVLSETAGYNSLGIRPPPTAVVLCDLGASATDTPVFDSDPSSNVNYVYYISAPYTPLQATTFIPEQYNIFGIDVFPGASRAYLACGQLAQVQVLDLEGALPKASSLSGLLVPDAQIDLPELTGTSHDYHDHGWNILADDLNPGERFFVVSPVGFHTHLVSAPTAVYVTATEPFGKGSSHDLLRTTIGDISNEPVQFDFVISATTGSVDYICKMLDVTTDSTSGIPLRSTGGRAAAQFTVDGAVVIPHTYSGPIQRDDVYISTWGGVAKFNPDSSLVYTSEPNRYQPAVAVGESNSDVHVTEFIAKGSVSQGVGNTNTDFLFTAAAKGNFLAYRTDANDGYRPLQPIRYDADPALLPNGWSYSTDIFYSNDLAFLDLQPSSSSAGKYVLTDLSRLSPSLGTRSEVLLAYEWLPASSSWSHVARSTESSSYPVDAVFPVALSTTITVAPNKNWIIVAHGRGFFSVKQDLAGATPLAIVTDVTPVIPHSPTNVSVEVAGLAASNTRVFAYLNPHMDGIPSEIRIYAIDSSTGAITTTGYQTIANSAYQVVSGTPVLRGWRGRFDVSPSPSVYDGSVYFACTQYVLRFEWALGSGNPTTDAFVFANWWESNYKGNFGECLPFTRTGASTRSLLIVKDRETFAIAPAY